MKKILLYGLKYLNYFTNEQVSSDQEAESILRYLLLKSDTIHTINVNEALQRKLFIHMKEEKLKAIKTIETIDSAYKWDHAFSFNTLN